MFVSQSKRFKTLFCNMNRVVVVDVIDKRIQGDNSAAEERGHFEQKNHCWCDSPSGLIS